MASLRGRASRGSFGKGQDDDAREELPMRKLMPDVVHDQTPLTLSPDTTVKEACRRMQDRRASAVVVTKDRAPLGIFTGYDAVCRVIAQGRDPATTPLDAVMTREPATLPPRAMAIDALRVMRDGGFRHVVIVDKGCVVGMVCRRDFHGDEQGRLDEETGLWERI
jgi:CBS domain-containing protein